jgi:hypothetical protein
MLLIFKDLHTFRNPPVGELIMKVIYITHTSVGIEPAPTKLEGSILTVKQLRQASSFSI